MNALLAIATLAGVLGVFGAIGLALSRLLATGPPAEEDWVDAPALGLSLVVVVLQPLTMLGLPLRVGAGVVIAVALAMACRVARRDGARRLLSACPAVVLVMAAVVLAVHGAGLLLAGPASYAGRGWGDQVNYASLAYYLTEFSYGELPLPSEPVALIGVKHADARIGQSIVQAFVGVVLQVGPRVAFEPLILLGPVLVGLAFVAIGNVLTVPRAINALLAGMASLVPALATLHLECFLSQALAVPLVLHLTALMARAGERRTKASYARAAIVYAAATAIYFEYLPLLAACVLTGILVSLPAAGHRARHLLAGAIIVVCPFVLGLGQGYAKVFRYMGTPFLARLYPWAVSLEGMERLWFGDLAGLPEVGSWLAVKVLTVLMLVAGAYGLLRLVEQHLLDARHDVSRTPRLAMAAGLLGVVAVPVAVLFRSELLAYQFYKTLMGAAPVVAWAAGFTIWRLLPEHRWGQRLAMASVAIIGVVCGFATLDMTAAAAHADLPPSEHTRRRQTTELMLNPSLRATAGALGQITQGEVFVCATDATWNSAHANAWLSFAARHRPTWAINPRLNDSHITSLVSEPYWPRVPPPAPGDTVVEGGAGGWLWAGAEVSEAMEPRPYSATAWGGRRLGLCGAGLSGSAASGTVLSVAGAGAELVAVSAGAQDAVLLFGDPAPGTTAVQVSSDPASAPVRPGPHGWTALPLRLEPGARVITLSRPGATPDAALLTRVALFDAARALPLPHVENPNGVERVEGKRFFWLGAGAATVAYFSPEDGTAALTVDGILGPSLAGTAVRHIAVTSQDQTTVVETRGDRFDVEVPVRAGWGTLQVQALDAPDTTLPTDPRTLLFGVRHLELRPRQPGTSARSR